MKRNDTASELDRQIRVEQPVAAEGFRGAGSGTWSTVDDQVYVSIKDLLPSRAEQLGEGISFASRPARIRMRYRTDITAAMRFVEGDRIMQIVAGPAEIGRRDKIEFMVEDYRPAGNPA